jgi:hypothetical protein
VKEKDLRQMGAFLRRGAIATILVILTGCAAPHSDLLFKEKKLTSDNVGLVVMALGYKTPADSQMVKDIKKVGLHINFESTTNSAGAKYQITTNAHYFETGAWDDAVVVRMNSGGKRVLVGYVIPHGKYVLTEQSVSLWGRLDWTARPPLARPREFEVRPNSVTYLGVREVDVESEKNRWGVTLPVGVRINALNEFEDDIELLYRNRPDLRNVSIINVFDQ